MTEQAVITGTFADLKLIKTRSVVQLVVEAPIEEAKRITDALGFPIPGHEVAVAIARLKDAAVKITERKASLAQQAGILCNDPRFVKFIAESCPQVKAPRSGDECADAVRMVCGVDSRAEFDTDAAAGQRWKSLKGKFDAWVMVA